MKLARVIREVKFCHKRGPASGLAWSSACCTFSSWTHNNLPDFLQLIGGTSRLVCLQQSIRQQPWVLSDIQKRVQCLALLIRGAQIEVWVFWWFFLSLGNYFFIIFSFFLTDTKAKNNLLFNGLQPRTCKKCWQSTRTGIFMVKTPWDNKRNCSAETFHVTPGKKNNVNFLSPWEQ